VLFIVMGGRLDPAATVLVVVQVRDVSVQVQPVPDADLRAKGGLRWAVMTPVLAEVPLLLMVMVLVMVPPAAAGELGPVMAGARLTPEIVWGITGLSWSSVLSVSTPPLGMSSMVA
jgi:hypothetical protein